MNSRLFVVEMKWGQQPVRLTGRRRDTLPIDAPTTSVHIVAFHPDGVLVVRDRKGTYGFPGGRLEKGETLSQALAREVHEEANAGVEPDYTLFASLKIECTAKLPGRFYPYPYSYMAMYAGTVSVLDPFTPDPAGIILERALFGPAECTQRLEPHDRILLREAVNALCIQPGREALLRNFIEDKERKSA